MTNELIIVDKIEKRLRTPREETIFPLTPTHRKELRQLRSENVGGLRSRLNVIKSQKKDEYISKHKAEIEATLEGKKKLCETLNTDWKKRIEKIQVILKGRKDLEAKKDLTNITIEKGYNRVSELNVTLKNEYRNVFLRGGEVSERIAEEQFNKKYGKAFDKVNEIINDLVTKYDEAINFGDLELVRQLYYTMKDSEKLFKQVSEMVV